MLMQEPPRHLKANPTLKTVHEVERILRDAHAKREPALSYTEIGRRMAAKMVRFDVVKTSVLELARHHFVAVGSDGVMWIVQPESVSRRPHEPLE